MNEVRNSLPQLPIACSLSRSEQVTRSAEISDLFKGVQEVKEVAGGYAFRFQESTQWAVRLLNFIVAERSCCPFFTFELVFEPDQGPIWLRLSGPEGVKETIASMF